MKGKEENRVVHCDMDAFFAAVEIRDNPDLAGKPLIIGALPSERGVVSTCSYEARKFGVRSAMSIKEAYRLCPDGIYMHPNGHKYTEASRQIHKIWDDYTDICEPISLDEGFLDLPEPRIYSAAQMLSVMTSNAE
jgi:DNA polymerase-4/DNA polymerase IV (DinB-like DNA polymerase)